MKYQAFNRTRFKSSEYYQKLPLAEKKVFDTLTHFFPFKANNYVLENLIEWDLVPHDPMYRLLFPRKEILGEARYSRVKQIFDSNLDPKGQSEKLKEIKDEVKPAIKFFPSSIPHMQGKPLTGLFRSFRTILNLFPDPMLKTCHAYCSYCFRWNAFGDYKAQQTTTYSDPELPVAFLKKNPEINEVLFTGADPLMLNSKVIKKFIDPILDIDSVKVIRLSSKALAFWPFRFTTDSDADSLLSLFDYIKSRGKGLSLSAHFSLPRELDHPEVTKAIMRIRNTGAVIRTQAPIVVGVNDNSKAWSDLWMKQITLGLVPYYMFVESGALPESCFRVPLAKALEIFQNAQRDTCGLARTVRGPVFMNDLNRTLLSGVTEIKGEKFFVLKTLQCPPGLASEGAIQLLPFDSKLKDLGNLFELFNCSIPETI